MLYLVATPIGNLGDISLRALETLREVDIVISEDTRKTGMLLHHFEIKKPLISFREDNETRALPKVMEQKTCRIVVKSSNAIMPVRKALGACHVTV